MHGCPVPVSSLLKSVPNIYQSVRFFAYDSASDSGHVHWISKV